MKHTQDGSRVHIATVQMKNSFFGKEQA